MENIPSTDIKKVRKLPKRWRKANEIFQIGMLFLAFANAILVVVNSDTNDIPKMYFEVYAVVISALPTLWSRLLDEVKVFEEMKTPHNTIDTNESQNYISAHITEAPSADSESSAFSSPSSNSENSSNTIRRSRSASDINDIHLTRDFIEILQSHHVIERIAHMTPVTQES